MVRRPQEGRRSRKGAEGSSEYGTEAAAAGARGTLWAPAGDGGLGARFGPALALVRARHGVAVGRAETRRAAVDAEPPTGHLEGIGVPLAQRPHVGGQAAVGGAGVARLVVQPRAAGVVIVSEPGRSRAGTSRAGTVS